MREISEEKRNFRKKTKSKNNLIVLVGLFLSLIGAIVFIYTGIDELINATEEELYYYSMYFYALIALAALTIFGDILGFYKKAVGIGVSLVIGIIGFIMTIVLGMGAGDLGLIIPILLILIGGIVGFSANYENLKAWKEQNFPSKHKREAGWKKKLILPGVIFLILGGILIFLSFYYLLPWQIAHGVETNVSILFFPGMIFMIIGPVLIIYSVIKLYIYRKDH